MSNFVTATEADTRDLYNLACQSHLLAGTYNLCIRLCMSVPTKIYTPIKVVQSKILQLAEAACRVFTEFADEVVQAIMTAGEVAGTLRRSALRGLQACR